jgi:probable FeS assembly SUF system protein SufT
MRYSEPIAIRRDVNAIQIPAGMPMKIYAGAEVRITQALGDTYTVVTEDGYMARIESIDADALGIESNTGAYASTVDVDLPIDQVEERVWDALRTVYDPEIPVNVVELGLIYSCIVSPLPEGGYRVDVKMTLTAPGCGMGPVLQDEARRKVLQVPTVKDALVEVVWEPAWDRTMMSEAARLQLGL